MTEKDSNNVIPLFSKKSKRTEYPPTEVVASEFEDHPSSKAKRKPKTNSTWGDSTHKWLFLPRFRSSAFGWKSDTPIKRLKEAVSEIKKVARKEPILAAEGSIKLIERISNALMNVDGSSGAMGSAVNAAIEELVKIISSAKCDTETRAYWLKRLYDAHEADEIPYIEALADYFGELCASKELASKWADKLIEPTKSYLIDRKSFMSSFSGTSVCLSCLFKAERYDELLQLLSCYQYNFLDYKSWGAKALAAQGKIDEALEYAESCKDSRNVYEDIQISQLCEEILLQTNQEKHRQQAYDNYALRANQRTTNLATFRAIKKKYPQVEPQKILADLIAIESDSKGKWFATAKDIGEFDLAIELAKNSPCDPFTLMRASRDFSDSNPGFAMQAGFLALHWFIQGYGYEISNYDIYHCLDYARAAASKIGKENELVACINDRIKNANPKDFVVKALREKL